MANSGAMSFNIINIHGIVYNSGVFTLNNIFPNPAVYLVNVSYSCYGTEFDSGYFVVEANINSSGNVAYGNSVNAINGNNGGGSTTCIIVVPALGTCSMIVNVSGGFNSDQISITIVQVDNN